MRDHSTMVIDTPADYDRAAGRLCLAIAETWTSNPNAWTQHAGATDDRGLPVCADSPKACAWCALGIIVRLSTDVFPQFSHQDRAIVRDRALNEVQSAENRRLRADYKGVHQINDHAWKDATDAAGAFQRAAGELLKRAQRRDEREEARARRRMQDAIDAEEERTAHGGAWS